MTGPGATDLERDFDARVRAFDDYARRTAVLRELMAVLASARSEAEVADAVSARGAALFGAAATLVFGLNRAGTHLDLLSSDEGSADRLAPWRHIPLDAAEPLCVAVKSDTPSWLGSREELLARHPHLASIVRDGAGLQGVVAVPMRDRDAVIGGIACSFYAPPDLSPVQRDFYLTVAAQCGLTLERSRLLEAERQAHAAELRAKERLALVAEASALLTSSLDSRRAVVELARAVVPALGAWCAIDERAADGGTTQIVLHHRDPERLALAARLNREYPPVPDESRGVRKVLRTGQTEFVPSIPPELLAASARDATHLELLRGLNLSSYAIVAIRARGKVLGALSLVTEGDHHLDDDDVRLVEDLAGRAGLALDNARLYEAVDAARGQLHELLMRLPAAIAILRGPELRYELMNEEARAMLEHPHVLGRPIRDVFPALAGTGFFERLERVYTTGEPYVALEAPVQDAVFPGGRYFKLVYQPTRDASGSVDGLVTFAFDITHQVRARQQSEALAEELARSEARMRALVDVAAAVVWTATARGERVVASPSWLAFTGLSASEYGDEAFAQAIHPDDRGSAEAAWRAAVAVGAPYVAEYRLRRRDGTYAHMLARGTPVLDGDGRVVEYVGCNVDVSELREAEAVATEQVAIQQELNALSHLLAAEHDVTTVVAAAADVATRLTHAEWGSFSADAPDPPADRLLRSRLVVPVVSRTQQRFGVLSFGHSEADRFDAQAQAIAVRIAEKTALALDNARLHDEARRLIASLEVSNRELDQFAYVASHDLRAPLRAIASLAEWIEEDLGPAMNADVRSKMVLLRSRVQRMESLIEGILAFSRVGRGPARHEAVDVAVLLDEIVDLIGPSPQQRVEIGQGMPSLMTDRVALEQVFMNLITNGLKYAGRPDARVRVDVQDTDHFWRFTVADNGPGVPTEFHDRVWAIFQTLQPRDRVESTGIGLAIVKKIVDGRGGRAWIEAVDGGGAAFCFTWPKREDRRP